MPKYNVFVNEVHRACYVVEAIDEEDAIYKVTEECNYIYQVYQEYGYLIEDDAYAELVEEKDGIS